MAEDLGRSPGRTLPEPVFGADDRRRGLVVGLVITALAAITRLWDLTHPTDKGTPVFDEKHYVPQAWQVLTGGNWIEDNPAYGLVVHPPVGKWLLALGQAVFGYGPMGWRILPALCGIGIVVMVYCIARRIARSTLVGAMAGLLAICDGVLFVQSRMGMLDIFAAFFIVAAFAALLADRDQMRRRLDDAHRAAKGNGGRFAADCFDSDFGPRFGFRWYRFTAGVMLGLACGTKWSGIYFVLAFTLMSLAFDVAARRAYGVRRPWLGVLRRDLVPSAASLSVMPILIYLASFAPWFASETSVYRYHETGSGTGAFGWVPAAWRSLWYYQSGILRFHEGLTSSAGNHHPWESKPWTWPMGLRPMLYAVETGPDRCGDGDCARVQMLIGTPAIWWLALPVLAWSLWAFLGRRDWRYGVALLGYGAAFAPWFLTIDRQMYFFYATLMTPFLVVLIALCLGDALRWAAALPRRADGGAPDRQILVLAAVAVYLALVVLNFAWLWPVLAGVPITKLHWHQEIWLPSWS
ncbi:dolichyl-phosphate-mannose--protein mannosyltransferase [Gordonia crocea]|uniref:dolichyl-phosphate-mannose--protein mannosyltransferase n=1 Tax=Gordonia crocea TaxID=589162 RepID=UPI001E3827C8|nr:phospholipid carrier-dependent glycosyltransferase [Gordonia crocea]